MDINIKENKINEEIVRKGMEKLFNDFQIFSEDFNTSHMGLLLMTFILNLKPEKWDEPEISYEKFCKALEIVKNNKYIKKLLQTKSD